MKSKKPDIRNFVHKASIEINKPKVFRDRKKEYARKQKYEEFELEHPVHRPYSCTSDKNKNIEEEYLDEYEDFEDEPEEELPEEEDEE